MAVEAKRGCGYRKVGGIYLVGSGSGIPCDRLPFKLECCPTCSQGIKYARGWTWVDVPKLVGGKHLPMLYPFNKNYGDDKLCQCGDPYYRHFDTYDNMAPIGCKYCECRTFVPVTEELCPDGPECPLCGQPETIGRAGLLWIGNQFYKNPGEFIAEANALGISRRIRAVPRGFKLGQTWVLLAHIKAVMEEEEVATDLEIPDVKKIVFKPGIFRIFKPLRIEKIITESQSKDAEFMEDLKDKGLTPVIVPDNDPDHQGTVFDKPEEEE